MKGNLETSVNCFQRALQINPKSTETRNVLGAIYQEMGFLDKAEQEFKTALSDSTYVSRELPYYNLARLYIIKEEYETALGYVQKALEFDPRMVLSHNLKGIIMENLQRWEDAIVCYEEALKIAPDDVNIKFNLGVAHYKNNDLSEAKRIFEDIRPDVMDPEMKSKLEEYLKTIR
jgi:Flp pilus assembly protein TadD